MKKTNLIYLIAAIALLISCNGLKPKDYTEMPSGTDFKEVADVLVKRLGGNPVFYEINGTFRITAGSKQAFFEAIIVSGEETKKLYEYTYNMIDAMWVGPTEITLHDNSKNNVEYDEYKDCLFTVNEFPDFTKLDDLYKEALFNSEFEKDECYVSAFKMEKPDGNQELSVVVQSREKSTRRNTFWFDNDGNIIDSE